MSSGKKFASGAVVGVVGLLLKTALNIFTYPVILKSLGLAQYGLYILMFNLCELVLMMDLGLTTGLIHQVSTCNAQGQTIEKKRLLSVAFYLYGSLSLLSCLFCTWLVPWIPSFMGFSPGISAIAISCLYLIVIEGALTLFQSYFSAVLKAYSFYHFSNAADYLYFIISNAGIFVLLHYGYGLKEMAALRLGAAILKFLMVFCYAIIVDSDCIKPFYFNIKQIWQLLSVSFHSMVRSLSDIFATRLNLLMIGKFLSLGEVAAFEFVYRLLNILIQIPQQISAGIFPIFTNLMVLGKVDSARQIFLRLSALMALVMALPVMLLCVFYQDIFTFFAAGKLDFHLSTLLLWLAVPSFISVALSFPGSHFLFSAGKYRYISSTSLIYSLIRIALTFVLLKSLGIFGIGIAEMVTAIVYQQIWIIRESCRELSISGQAYWQTVYGQPLLAFCPASLLALALKFVEPMSALPPLLYFLLTSTIVYSAGLLGWFILTATETEKAMLSRFFQTTPKNTLKALT
jgi:O-antigen/teichoic acid export membrane protein